MKRIATILALLVGLSTTAMAQDDLHIGYIYPAGGRQGSTFEAVIAGQHIVNASGVNVSGTGVSATIIKQEKQLTPSEQKELTERLSQIQEKRKQGQWPTQEEIKAAQDIKNKLDHFGRRLTNPSLGEFITLQVVVAADALPGDREIRLMTQAGLSNPRVFNVGELPEVSKADWKNVPQGRGSMDAAIDPKPPEVDITLPVILNGQIPPGGVDRYRFKAREGQQVVINVRARDLIPYISDAVPGWFQATVVLHDAQGKELAYAGNYRFRPDPVLFYRIPGNGEYVIEIRDALYRGREDFVYRVTVGEVPFITSVFPLGGKIGGQTPVAVDGWNLSADHFTLGLKDETPGIHSVHRERLGNGVQVAADTLPEVFEKEPNSSADAAQSVTLPVTINGRIDQPGDVDIFRFDGKAGEPVVAEVLARRLDSPLDSVLALTDAEGKQIGFNDDHEDKGSGLNTHHADSYLAMTLPATGRYYLQIGDTQHGGGKDYGYRLRISAPRLDFDLRIVPSSVNIRGGMCAPLTVYALRKDGFPGEITLSLKDAPQGFTLTGARVPGDRDKARFTLNAPPSSAMKPFSLHIEGRAMVHGRETIRSAVPADDTLQAFAYHHLVPAQEQKVAVLGRFMAPESVRVLTATPLRIPLGGTAQIKAAMPVGPAIAKVEYSLSEPPEGITIKSARFADGVAEIILQTDAASAKIGSKGTLIIQASGERTMPTENQPVVAANRRVPLGALPAVEFEVVQR